MTESAPPPGPPPPDEPPGTPPPGGAPPPPPPAYAPPQAAPPGGQHAAPAPPGQAVPPGYTAQPPAVAGELAIKRSGWRVTLCSIASLGVYSFYWFYQYRKRMNAEFARKDEAALHTAGLMVPFLNYYIVYLLWKDISDARQRVGLSEIPVVAYVVGTFFVAPLFYLIVNANLNEYWDRRTGGQATDAPFTRGEKLATFLPMVLFGGFIVLIIVIALAAGS
jgi:hypothetical protein